MDQYSVAKEERQGQRWPPFFYYTFLPIITNFDGWPTLILSPYQISSDNWLRILGYSISEKQVII